MSPSWLLLGGPTWNPELPQLCGDCLAVDSERLGDSPQRLPRPPTSGP